MPNPDPGAPNGAIRLDDRALMTFGMLAFGISIPLVAGLYGDLGPRDGRTWLGAAGFIALAASLWLGNRWLLLRQREHFDWFANPWRKLALLVSANVLFTAPLTMLTLVAWYRVRGVPADADAIRVVTLTNVICVLFVTHAYETVFLIREREGDLLRVAQLERLRAQAELDALKAQLDPHFLFNSLNTLGHLVRREPEAARRFCDSLAEVYRYVLAARERDLVPLAEELDFAQAYHRLLALRFGDSIRLEIDGGSELVARHRVPPLALQTLLENAVKHNQLGPGSPLHVRMVVGAQGVDVDNPVNPRSSRKPSTGVGLRNLDERCRGLMARGLAIERGDSFRVHVPTLPS